MSKPKMSHKAANAISFGILLVGLGAISILDDWWPALLLPIGLSQAVRQYLRGRPYDTCLTTFIFGGLFLFQQTDVNWDVVLPVLFTIGGIYLIFREIFLYKSRSGMEEQEEMRVEIDDEYHEEK